MLKFLRLGFFVLTTLLLVGIDGFSQPGGGGPGGGEDPDNPIPITGIEWLIAAGAGLGARKLYKMKATKR
jgi:hypothetical protein